MIGNKVFIVVYYDLGGGSYITEVFDSEDKALEYVESDSKYYNGDYEVVIKDIL